MRKISPRYKETTITAVADMYRIGSPENGTQWECTPNAEDAHKAKLNGYEVTEYVTLERYVKAVMLNHSEQSLEMVNSPLIPDSLEFCSTISIEMRMLVEQLISAIEKEQDRLFEEDYLMDSKECIDVIREEIVRIEQRLLAKAPQPEASHE